MRIRKNRFTPEEKLSVSADYQRVFQLNNRLRDKYWIILYRPNGEKKSRLGLAIAKKNVRKATKRNLIKRIVRESFRQKKGNEIISGYDIVVMSRPGAGEAGNKILFSTLEMLWQKME